MVLDQLMWDAVQMRRAGSIATLTVAIVTRNEAELLEGCLNSVVGADEVLVLDMESSDGTPRVAAERGARVLSIPHSPVVERARQYGVDATTTDWLLWLDPDERVPGDLRKLLRPHLTAPVAGYWVPFADIVFGHETPSLSAAAAKICLVRPQQAFWPPDAPAHSQPLVDGAVDTLVGRVPAFVHLGQTTVGEHLEKLTRYAESGGATVSDVTAADPFLLPRLLWRVYVGRDAWRDGTAGMVAGSLAAIGDYFAALHRWEREGYQQTDPRPRDRIVLGSLKRASKAVHRLRHLALTIRVRR
jgi:glycosyltransferase involved in cell wall biosynthesis